MSRFRDKGRSLSGRQSRAVRRALREAAAMNEELARSIHPFRGSAEKRQWQANMKRAGEYRRVRKLLLKRSA